MGFVGLGNQGGPMALRIAQAGLPLTVWARRPDVLAEFVRAGAVRAETLHELGAASSLVAVCVTTDDDVRQVVLGAVDSDVVTGGLLAAMAPGSSLAIHSTAHPETVRQIAKLCARRSVSVVDAPVSGGNIGAQAGTMAILVGGEAEIVDRWRPVWATFASSVSLLGGVGAGQHAKLVNNALAAANLGTALRALDSAQRAGLDRVVVGEVLAASSGASFMLGAARGANAEGLSLAAARLRKDVAIYADVLTPDDEDGAALAAAAEVAVRYLEELST